MFSKFIIECAGSIMAIGTECGMGESSSHSRLICYVHFHSSAIATKGMNPPRLLLAIGYIGDVRLGSLSRRKKSLNSKHVEGKENSVRYLS